MNSKAVRITQRVLTDQEWRKRYVLASPVGKLLSDEVYLKAMYQLMMGRELNLENPQTFNEKLQWLKLHDRKPIYTTMVDKYLAKEYVAESIGREYIIPTLGVWNQFDDINFDELPDKFVLKTTNDSGSIVICKNKEQFNITNAKKKIEKGLKKNFFYASREWPYKNVKPRIIAEDYISDGKNDELIDYKFYCFHGKPEFLYLSQGLDNHKTARINYVTLEWEKTKFHRLDFAEFEKIPDRPQNLDEMIELAKKLSENIPFVRVDFYNINQKIYFGELTFYPGGGFTFFEPEKYDFVVGELLNLQTLENR